MGTPCYGPNRAEVNTRGTPPPRAYESRNLAVPGAPPPPAPAIASAARCPGSARLSGQDHATRVLTPLAVADREVGRAQDDPIAAHPRPFHVRSDHGTARVGTRCAASAQPRAHRHRARSPRLGRPGQTEPSTEARGGHGRPTGGNPGRETGVNGGERPSATAREGAWSGCNVGHCHAYPLTCLSDSLISVSESRDGSRAKGSTPG